MWRALILLVACGCTLADDLRLNQVQVVGTHNSYHIAPAPAVFDLIAVTGKSRAESLNYTHRPLGEQFGKQGIRQIELDLYADPKGGLFADPNARTLVKKHGKDAGPDPNGDGVLAKPGFKVLHVPDIDYLSTVPTFIAALRQIREWSRANPKHVPIMVLVELKADAVPLLPTRPVPFDAKLLDDVDTEILSVFQRDELVTPASVRGDSGGLREAISKRGWPRLDDVRGKIMFCLDNTDRLAGMYTGDRRDRVMFAQVAETDPAAAFFKINDPIGDFQRIERLVKAGFLVRTRADEATMQARKHDTTRRDKALASGAQFVSTDFPEPRLEWSDYCVRLPGNAIARPNPVSATGVKEVELERR